MSKLLTKIFCLISPVVMASVALADVAPFSKVGPNKPPITITLHDAVLLTLRNNPTVEQAEIQRIADKFAVVVAKYQFEPQYAFQAGYVYTNTRSNGKSSYSGSGTAAPSVKLENHYGTQFSAVSGNTFSNGVYNPSLALSVTQPLIQGFGKPVVEATLNNALDTEIINQLNLKNALITAVVTVINDYLTLLQDYQTLFVDQLSLKNYQQTVANDKLLIKAGQMARSDIVQAQAQVESQQATIQADLNNIDTDRNTLSSDLGLPPQTNLVLPKNLNFDQVTKEILGAAQLPSMDAAENIALGNDINYQVGAITIRTLRRSLLQAQDQDRPTLNLTASETLGGGSGGSDNAGLKSMFNGTNHAEAVGVALTVPIDDVPAQQSIIDAQVGLEKALIGLTQQKRQLIDTVDTQYRTVLSNWRTLQIQRRALALQQQTVNIAVEKQIAGLISTFQVITNQQTLATTQETLVNDEISYLKSIVSYEQTLGNVLDPWHIKIKY